MVGVPERCMLGALLGWAVLDSVFLVVVLVVVVGRGGTTRRVPFDVRYDETIHR